MDASHPDYHCIVHNKGSAECSLPYPEDGIWCISNAYCIIHGYHSMTVDCVDCIYGE